MITGKFSRLFALSLLTGALLAGSAFAADQGTLYPEGTIDKEALFVIVALLSAFVLSLKRPWARIAVRVTGSWIFASGLLMLGWMLKGHW